MGVEISVDAFVEKIEIINQSGQEATVAVYDRRPVPVAVIPPQKLQDGGILTYGCDGGRRMTGGVQWVSNVENVFGFIRGRIEENNS